MGIYFPTLVGCIMNMNARQTPENSESNLSGSYFNKRGYLLVNIQFAKGSVHRALFLDESMCAIWIGGYG